MLNEIILKIHVGTPGTLEQSHDGAIFTTASEISLSKSKQQLLQMMMIIHDTENRVISDDIYSTNILMETLQHEKNLAARDHLNTRDEQYSTKYEMNNGKMI